LSGQQGHTTCIATGADTDLYLYYDGAKPDNTTYVGDTNTPPAENVWDGNFALVCHMRDDPDASHIRDSTSNNNDGTKKAAAEPAATTNGKIDDAENFDGADDWVNSGSGSSLVAGNVTIEVWSNIAVQPLCIVAKSNPAAAAPWRQYLMGYSSASKLMLGADINGTWTNVVVEDNPAPSGVQYQAATYDGSYGRLYRDGATEPIKENAVSGSIGSHPAWPLYIGSSAYGSATPVDVPSGWLDELRISKTARLPAWIKASYESGRDHLMDFGSEETATVGHTKTKIVDPSGNSGVYTSIQSALDAASNEGGGVVYVEKGTYTITSPLIIDSNVALIGRGNVVVQIDTNYNISALKNKTQTGDGNSRIYVSGIRIVSRPAGVNNHLIDFQLVKDSVLEDISIDGQTRTSDYAGIYVKGLGANRISRCIVQKCWNGIYLYDGTVRNVVEDCRIQTVNFGLVVTKNSERNIIRNNHIHDTVTPNGFGIHVQGSNYLVVQGNTLEACAGHAVYVQANAMMGGGCKGLAIVGNVCKASQSSGIDGIHLEGISSYSVDQNTVAGNSCSFEDNGIYIYNYCRGNSVAGNNCSENVTGIHEGGTNTSYNTMVGNTCVGNTTPITWTGPPSIEEHNIKL